MKGEERRGEKSDKCSIQGANPRLVASYPANLDLDMRKRGVAAESHVNRFYRSSLMDVKVN